MSQSVQSSFRICLGVFYGAVVVRYVTTDAERITTVASLTASNNFEGL